MGKRGTARVVEFDVMDDDDDFDDGFNANATAVPAPETTPAGARATQNPAGDALSRGIRSRRRLMPVAMIAVVLAILLAAGSTWQEHLTQGRLRAAPGGVLSLAAPPKERWDVAHVGGAPTVMGGALVLTTGSALVGVDPESGARRWSVPEIRGEAACSMNYPFLPSAPLDQLVCITYEDHTVWSIDEQGEVVAKREIADIEKFGEAWVGPGSTIIRTRRDGEHVAVRLEDAATGRLLWKHDVPSRRPGPNECMTWTGDEQVQDADNVGAYDIGGLVMVRGCGVGATFTTAGTPLQGVLTDRGTDEGWTVPLPDGRFAQLLSTESGESRTAVLTADGATQRIVESSDLLWVRTTDSPSAAPVFVSLPGSVLALDGEGRDRWTLDRGVESCVAVVGDIAVFETSGSELIGGGVGSGAVLWERESEGVPTTVSNSFTDGNLLLVVDGETSTSSGRLTTLDAVSGRTVWGSTARFSGWGFTSAGGTLLHVDDETGRLTAFD